MLWRTLVTSKYTIAINADTNVPCHVLRLVHLLTFVAEVTFTAEVAVRVDAISSRATLEYLAFIHVHLTPSS